MTTATSESTGEITLEALHKWMEDFIPQPQLKIITDPVTGNRYAYDPDKLILAPAAIPPLEPFQKSFFEDPARFRIPWGLIKPSPLIMISATEYGEYTLPKRHQDHTRWSRKKEQARQNSLRLLRSTKHNQGSNRKRRWLRLFIRYSEKASR